MKEEIFTINGMSCNHCVMAVRKELSKLQLETCDVKIGSAIVSYDENKITQNEIELAINEAGFEVVK